MSHLRRPDYREVRATDEESRGFYNSPRIIEVVLKRKPVRINISPGRNDDIDVASQGDWLFVACVNTRFPYIGCEVFNFDGELVSDIFAQGSEQCAELFNQEAGDDGAPWEEWSSRYLWTRIRDIAAEVAGNA